MEPSVVRLLIKVRAGAKQDGDQWVACCPPLDVYSQGDTEKAAMDALSEAVQAWFESCVERGVVGEALKECGFLKISTAHSA